MKKRRFNKLAGFTLDQTILVVAVIAVLATIIISSVAWNVLNRANATKLTAHLQQISDAIGSFYQDGDASGNLHIWPANASDLSIYLAGYTVDANNLKTPFGTSTASILILNSTGKSLGATGPDGGTDCSKSTRDCYITVTMDQLQAQEAEQANEAIDGAAESSANTQGRLRWTNGKSGSELVTITYYAVKKS